MDLELLQHSFKTAVWSCYPKFRYGLHITIYTL